MPKEIPDCPQKPNPAPQASRRYEVELITPMVGGGASSGEVDLLFPIRSTSVRGLLRNWWRLIGGFSLGEGMWRREEEIFGSTEFCSPLRVRVQASPIKDWVEPQDIHNTSLKYLLFPSIECNQRLAKEGITFRLELNWENEHSLNKRRAAQNQARKQEKKSLLPDRISGLDDEIDQAVRAWITFGGIGARTRRGCGALFAKEPKFPFHVADVQIWLRQFLHEGSSIEKIFCIQQPMNPVDAWKRVAETWKKFRQPGPAQRGEQRRRFPEAETIRRATGRRSRRVRAVSEEEMPNGFPRAELGLPIIFQFKDASDPETTTVNRAGTDAAGRPFQRMASPFILRPLALGKGQAVPMIVLLKSPRVSSVHIAPAPRGDGVFPVLGSPIIDSSAGSAIEAFLAFARAEGFSEVTQ